MSVTFDQPSDFPLLQHQIPDLSDLIRLLPRLQLLSIFVGVPEKAAWSSRRNWRDLDPEVRRGLYQVMSANVVRLTDRAIDMYNAGRSNLDALIETNASGNPVVGGYPHAITDFESCIHSLHRALQYSEKLFSHGLRRPGTASVFSTHAIELIGNLRDGIEHLDDDIASGSLTEGHIGALALKVAQLELKARPQGREPALLILSYSQLAAWIRQLHEFSVSLIHERTWNPATVESELRS